MLNHKWMKGKLRGFEHIQTDPEKIENALHAFKNKNRIKTDPIFYRELKDFAEELNDADASFEMDDETANPEVGFSRPSFTADKEPDSQKKFLERNFANTYIGYDEGIDVAGLDSTSNWQFTSQ